jgi:hypothetical protein
MTRTSNGLPVRMLNIIDEYTRECLCIKVAQNITAQNVLEELFDLMVQKGLPDHIRSDNVLNHESRTEFGKTSPLGRNRPFKSRVGIGFPSVLPQIKKPF